MPDFNFTNEDESEKRDLDNPRFNPHCQQCPQLSHCPWVSVADCFEAHSSYWFNGFYHDSSTGRVID